MPEESGIVISSQPVHGQKKIEELVSIVKIVFIIAWIK